MEMMPGGSAPPENPGGCLKKINVLPKAEAPPEGRMNILCIGGQILDFDQIASTLIKPGCVCLTFQNGDELPLSWRDESEKREILQSLGVQAAE